MDGRTDGCCERTNSGRSVIAMLTSKKTLNIYTCIYTCIQKHICILYKNNKNNFFTKKALWKTRSNIRVLGRLQSNPKSIKKYSYRHFIIQDAYIFMQYSMHYIFYRKFINVWESVPVDLGEFLNVWKSWRYKMLQATRSIQLPSSVWELNFWELINVAVIFHVSTLTWSEWT